MRTQLLHPANADFSDVDVPLLVQTGGEECLRDEIVEDFVQQIRAQYADRALPSHAVPPPVVLEVYKNCFHSFPVYMAMANPLLGGESVGAEVSASWESIARFAEDPFAAGAEALQPWTPPRDEAVVLVAADVAAHRLWSTRRSRLIACKEDVELVSATARSFLASSGKRSLRCGAAVVASLARLVWREYEQCMLEAISSGVDPFGYNSFWTMLVMESEVTQGIACLQTSCAERSALQRTSCAEGVALSN